MGKKPGPEAHAVLEKLVRYLVRHQKYGVFTGVPRKQVTEEHASYSWYMSRLKDKGIIGKGKGQHSQWSIPKELIDLCAKKGQKTLFDEEIVVVSPEDRAGVDNETPPEELIPQEEAPPVEEATPPPKEPFPDDGKKKSGFANRLVLSCPHCGVAIVDLNHVLRLERQ